MPEQKNHYQILQVDPEAEPEVIAAAYKRLAQKYHPDANKSPEATRRMQAINAAYDTLSDPLVRQRYDQAINRSLARPGPPPSPPAAPARTDQTAPARSERAQRARQRSRRARPHSAHSGTDSVLGCGSIIIFIGIALALFVIFESRLTSLVTAAALLVGAGLLTIPAVFFLDDYLRKS